MSASFSARSAAPRRWAPSRYAAPTPASTARPDGAQRVAGVRDDADARREVVREALGRLLHLNQRGRVREGVARGVPDLLEEWPPDQENEIRALERLPDRRRLEGERAAEARVPGGKGR